MKDWRGTPIEIGSVIVYPVSLSSSIRVNEAVVTEIAEKPHQWHDETITVLKARVTREASWRSSRSVERLVTLDRIDRVTVVA